MKKFHSRLTTFLKIKKEKEEAAKKKLFLLFHELQEMWINQEKIENEISLLSLRSESSLFSVEDAESTVNYVSVLQKKKMHLEKMIKFKVQEVEQARLEMIKSIKDKKVIENIQNKKKNIWKKLGDKLEEQSYDEIYTSKFPQKKADFEQHLKTQGDSHDEQNPNLT